MVVLSDLRTREGGDRVAVQGTLGVRVRTVSLEGARMSVPLLRGAQRTLVETRSKRRSEEVREMRPGRS